MRASGPGWDLNNEPAKWEMGNGKWEPLFNEPNGHTMRAGDLWRVRLGSLGLQLVVGFWTTVSGPKEKGGHWRAGAKRRVES